MQVGEGSHFERQRLTALTLFFLKNLVFASDLRRCLRLLKPVCWNVNDRQLNGKSTMVAHRALGGQEKVPRKEQMSFLLLPKHSSPGVLQYLPVFALCLSWLVLVFSCGQRQPHQKSPRTQCCFRETDRHPCEVLSVRAWAGGRGSQGTALC